MQNDTLASETHSNTNGLRYTSLLVNSVKMFEGKISLSLSLSLSPPLFFSLSLPLSLSRALNNRDCVLCCALADDRL